MCESIQLICAVIRIGIYSFFRRLCCKGPPPPKPTHSVICLGLAGSGKTTLLTVLSGETADIQPTVGFSIKSLLFEDCIVDVKELGGGDNVRPYWDRYYLGAQGLVLVVDCSADEETMNATKTELKKACEHPELQGLPVLLLCNKQNVEGSRSPQEISKFLEVEAEVKAHRWILQGCSSDSKDGIQEGFLQFNKKVAAYVEESEKTTKPEHNQL
ncbi:hypothetical protein ScPMuIL_018599 [Solemya velum]